MLNKRSAFFLKNTWRVRSIALGCIVVVLGLGSEIFVNTLPANADMLTLKVTAYALQGRMADGQWTHKGACAVYRPQFPFGTIIALYNTDGTLNRTCVAEDSGGAIGYNDIDLAMPGDLAGAIQWGVRYLPARVVRWGWGAPTAPPSPTAPPPAPVHMLNPLHSRTR